MRAPTLLLLLALPSTPVLADSEAGWDAFRAEVASACTALAEAPADATVQVEVNPFGSQSYGVALVEVTTPAGTDRMACIFDKATRAAELTAPFAPGA